MPILKTRLFKPLISKGDLRRERLFKKLDLNKDKPVLLVVAPAGYGKSVLVSQWLDHISENYSWVSLGKDCNDLKTFLRLLCSSILPYLSAKDDICDILIEAPELPDLEHVATHIVNSLADIEGEHILVLDDYHLIENPDIHKLMQILIENCKQNHIINFISRFEPPLNWDKLKSYDLVHEIKLVDLQFSPEEIQKLSTHFLPKPVDKETSSIICKSTEGWVVPARLILKNIAENELNPITLKNKITNKHEYTLGFLEDTFNQIDKESQESLMIASLFQRFSISLLTEISVNQYPERKQNEELKKSQIEKCIAQSLFIISLDKNKQWYRFHDLIRDFLTKRIYSVFSEGKINQALRVGSIFFEKEQSFEEAIALGIKSGDIPLSIDIIERNRLPFLNQQRLDVLERWLSLIPSDVIEDSPVLLLTRTILSEKKGEFQKMMQDLERAYAIMPELNDKDEHSCALWGEYYSIKSSVDFLMSDITMALESSKKAMLLLNHEIKFLYYFTMIYRGFALNVIGKSNEALALLEKDKTQHRSNGTKISAENYVIGTMLLMLKGKLKHYNKEAKLAMDVAKQESNKTVIVLAAYYLSLSSYMRNELEEALLYIQEALSIRYSARPYWVITCYQLKALCLLALEKKEDYESCLSDLKEFINHFNVPFYKNLHEIIKMEFSLLKIEDYKLPKLLKTIEFRSSDIVHVYFKPFLTEIKLLLATDNEQYLKQAETLLKDHRDKASATHNRVLLIQISSLNILLLSKQKQTEKALNLLRELLTETKDDSLIRLYTDCGHEMKSLFMQLTSEEKNNDYISKILQSFQLALWNQTTENSFQKNPNHNGAMVNTEEIKITFREIQLLDYLQEGLRNKEIAEELNITPDSVKKSLYRLYKKLSVNSRSDAIKVVKTIATAN